jgi:hypothetical protein
VHPSVPVLLAYAPWNANGITASPKTNTDAAITVIPTFLLEKPNRFMQPVTEKA